MDTNTGVTQEPGEKTSRNSPCVRELIPNQSFTPGNGDREVNQMAKPIGKKITMTLLKTNSLAKNKQFSVIEEPRIKNISEDRTSSLGHVDFSEPANKFFPYLTRSGEKFVALHMLEFKIFSQYTKFFNDDIPLCCNIELFKMTPLEAQLLNEISTEHCDNFFGTYVFSDRDHIIKLADATEIYTFFKFCYIKLVKQNSTSCKYCGFIKVASENFIPYVCLESKQYVPIFYLDGDCKYLEERSLELGGWELAYLKLLCKIQGVRKSLIDYKTIRVVELNVLKECYAPDTLFEESWPVENKSETLIRKPLPTENNPEHISDKEINRSEKTLDIKKLQVQTTPVLKNVKNTNTLKSAKSTIHCYTPKFKTAEAVAKGNVQNECRNSSQTVPSLDKSMVAEKTPTVPHTALPNLINNEQTEKSQLKCSPSDLIKQLNPIFISKVSNRKACQFFQIPEFVSTNSVCPYFILGCQIEDTFLKHCVNFAPFDTSVLLVPLEEVSSRLLKIPFPIVRKAVESLEFNVFLPNTEQTKLLHGLGIFPVMGLISTKNLKENIVGIRNICSLKSPQMLHCNYN